MRTIDATLLSNQAAVDGRPCRSVVVGTAPNTVDVSALVVGYDYEELDREAGLTLTLDNSGGEFSTLAGDYANITRGAVVAFQRGLTVAGTDYLAELPRTWVEAVSYEYVGGVSVCVLDCVDWWGKLARWRVAADQEWSATSAETILEWLLTQVGLTREAGSMTALSLDFAVRVREHGAAAVARLVRKMPEYLHPGLDGEVKWREIDAAEASAYTFGWNANHPVLLAETGEAAWEVNAVVVNGLGGATGTANDAGQAALVGTRRWTVYDERLSSNAECAQRAQAELDLFAAGEVEAQIVARPCHGLELWDVVTLASPPWGGSNFVGRVQRYREEWNQDGRWSQVIGLGAVPGKDPGNQPAAKKRSTGRRGRRGSGGGHRRPPSWADELPGLIPVGGIIAWSGASAAIPSDWALCDGSGGTPDLRDRFIVGAGSAYAVGATGGEAESDLAHTHGPGTLATDSDDHTHGPGTLATNSDDHTHGPGTLATNSDDHTHGPGTLATDSDDHTHGPGTLATDEDTHYHNLEVHTAGLIALGGGGRREYTDDDTHGHDVTSGVTASDSHDHSVASGATASDSHSHSVASGATASDSHSHSVASGATASDSHSHGVASGVTAAAGSATQENRPPYYALCWIMRVA